MTYLVNWRGYTHYVDISNDVITVDNNNFSIRRFLDNKFFKKIISYLWKENRRCIFEDFNYSR